MRVSALCVVLLMALLVLAPGASAWNDEDTHPAITVKAIKERTGLDAFLKEHLGLNEGIKSEIAHPDPDQGKKTVIKWAKEGATREDESPVFLPGVALRAWNHFHDPTVYPWDEAGLKGSWMGLSSVLWAQKPDQDSGPTACCGDYSWPDVRGYYYKAFTEADEAERDRNLAELFRGIGQLMHLVQDMAVPAHTRNDIHITALFPNMIEHWAVGEGNTPWGLSQPYSGPSLDPIFLSWVQHPDAPAPVSALWDIDRYDGASPPIGPGLLGMAEYANFNFFSSDTIFDYAYPLQAALNHGLGLYEEADGSLYLQKPATAFGGPVYHLAKLGSLADLLTSYALDLGLPVSSLFFDPPVYHLDDRCFREYSGYLLPYAVEYSAKLVDYFFRGKMSVRPVPLGGGSYGVAIRNDSDEPMGGGTLTIGRVCPAADGDSCPQAGRLVTTSGAIGSVTQGQWSSAAVPIDSIISGPQDLNDTFYLVYQGGLGEEPEAVAVRVEEQLPVLEERWSPSEGQVFTGSSGTIEGDLGTWRYMILIDGGPTQDCGNRIEINGGTLEVYECHHRYGDPWTGYHGLGAIRVWLDDFHQDQERLPLEKFEWDCNPAAGDLGEGGFSKCYLGLKDGGFRDDNPGIVTNDHLCLRGLGGGGSLYLGAGLLNESVAAETNESTMSISGIVLTPSAEMPDYPPADATELTETWRGITETFRPPPVKDIFTGYHKGGVRIPGDFGTWTFYIRGTQAPDGECDTRIHVENGVATVYECHKPFENPITHVVYSAGAWGLYMAEPYGDLTKTLLTQIDWDAFHTGPLGPDGVTTSAVGLKGRGLPGGLMEFSTMDPGPIGLDPADKLKVHEDVFVVEGITVPLIFRFGLYSDTEDAVNQTQAQVSNLTLTLYEEEQGAAAAATAMASTGRGILVTPRGGSEGAKPDPAMLSRAEALEDRAVSTHDMIDYSGF